MKRRQLLKYGSLGTAGLILGSCEQAWFPFRKTSNALGLDPSKLEKKDLIIGFVPTIEASPLIIAKEKGFFENYGLNVTLVRQNTWDEVAMGLREWRYDVGQNLLSLPLSAKFGANPAPLMSLMMLNLNGSAITLTQKAWDAGIRPSINYLDFREFSATFRSYARKLPKKLSMAIASPLSMESYLTRYWLAGMGIDPDKEVQWEAFSPSQMIYKLQAGIIEGYCAPSPWNQPAVAENAGFTAYTNRDIWQGHPGTILAAMQPWVDKHPTTTRALVAAVLESCQYCDDLSNRRVILPILAQKDYLNLDPLLLDPVLMGNYRYAPSAQSDYTQFIPDFTLFHYQETDYLQPPDQANYPWRSHGVWLLTQMLRWGQLKIKDYPKDGDKILDQLYPVNIYEEVAKGLNIPVPSERMKVEKSTVFVDHREFDPSDPVSYLNRFELRVSRPQWFA